MTPSELLALNHEALRALNKVDVRQADEKLYRNCWYCSVCTACLHCSNCMDCSDCTNCKDCIGIVGGKNLQYVAHGVQLTAEEFAQLKVKL